jgi:glycosyltransferase involved in cell wall biosynthesis
MMPDVREPVELMSPPQQRVAAIRAGVVCDLREERWPSMDLVGDMLCRYLSEDCAAEVAVTQLMPSLRQRFERVPLLPGKLARNTDRLMNRFVDYPSWLGARANDYDVFHIVDHSYSQLLHVLPAKRTIVTCHDLDTFRCLLEPRLEPRPRWFRAMARRILNGFLRAAHVIAVSGATRDNLQRHGLFPPERISVVWNGVHPAYSHLPSAGSEAKAAELMQQRGNDAVWLLSVGSTMPRKRLDVLLRVFAEVYREVPQACLVRVGGLTPELLQLAADLKIEQAILNVPFVEPEILSAVYRRTTLLLQTSDAEGFGLPLIESMASGCPVLASDITVLREVGGAAISYCPVGDIGAWARTVVDLIRERTERPESWKRRRESGVAQAAHFSWAENARQTALIYRQVAENR